MLRYLRGAQLYRLSMVAHGIVDGGSCPIESSMTKSSMTAEFYTDEKGNKELITVPILFLEELTNEQKNEPQLDVLPLKWV